MITDAILIDAIIQLTVQGLGEYRTITLTEVLRYLGIDPSNYQQYIKPFSRVMRVFSQCLVDKKVGSHGSRHGRKYILRRECVFNYLTLSNDLFSDT